MTRRYIIPMTTQHTNVVWSYIDGAVGGARHVFCITGKCQYNSPLRRYNFLKYSNAPL